MKQLTNKKTILFSLLIGVLSSATLFGQFPIEALGLESESVIEQAPVDFFSFRLERFDLNFFARLGINVLSMIILVRGIYYSVYRRREFFFTFFMFNLIIFIITVLLNANSGFSIGAAFGLFAIFAMLRYRTEDISARDMTYLFMSITIGLISSINMGTALEIGVINAIILLAAYLIEGNLLVKPEFFKIIEYERIDLIKPGEREALITDLRDRTGLDIHKVFVKRIDLLRDTATLKVYFYGAKNRDV